jgi:hypothetical protein
MGEGRLRQLIMALHYEYQWRAYDSVSGIVPTQSVVAGAVLVMLSRWCAAQRRLSGRLQVSTTRMPSSRFAARQTRPVDGLKT